MANIELDQGQIDAIRKMHNGCILHGGVGSGKTRTSLTYFYLYLGGKLKINGKGETTLPTERRDLYIITTAKKRDSLEWEDECCAFPFASTGINITVDSWNNIKKYTDVKTAFFIFDEQRLVGSGAWVKAFYKIAKFNAWVLLSATPGDTWTDYIPVFVANGFYKNKTEFQNEHCVYNRLASYPKLERYINTKKLMYYRDKLLVDIVVTNKTERHYENVWCDYQKDLYKWVTKNRFDPYKEEPIDQAAGLCYTWRRVVNSDVSRQIKLLQLLETHPRMIIYYSHNYELEILRNLGWPPGTIISEWNGQKHEAVPVGESWVYLCQYTAAAEGWNCITTDTIVFYSLNYSYKIMEQASGRIDRRNTPYTDLYYYIFKSKAPIDLAISKAIAEKKTFNENKFVQIKAEVTKTSDIPGQMSFEWGA